MTLRYLLPYPAARKFAVLALVSLIMLVSSGAALVEPKPDGAGSPALVRIGLRTVSDLDGLAQSGLQVYARLASNERGAYLLAPFDPSGMSILSDLGYPIEVLAHGDRTAAYYLLYGTAHELDAAGKVTPLLYTEGRHAVTMPSPSELEQLSSMQIKLRILTPYTLILPESSAVNSVPGDVDAEPLIQEIVTRIENDRLFYLDGSLSGEWSVSVNDKPYLIKTRYSYAEVPIKKATRFAYENFLTLNLPTWFDDYVMKDTAQRNVIMEQTGLTQPERILMMVAHIDSFSQNPTVSAPGADDNASGSAALSVIADVLSDYKFGCTLRYALFTGEEQGQYGSQAYAANVKQAGENIEAVLNLDMIAYNTPGSAPTIELHTRPQDGGDLAIANLFADVIAEYQLELQPHILQDGETFSDHSSFWDNGYPAILAIEDWEDHTPYYHNTRDQLETLNMAYFGEFARAAAATFAHMGCMLQGELSGTISDAESKSPIEGAYLETRGDNGVLRWTHTDADGKYRITLVPGIYQVFIAAPNYQSIELGSVEVVHAGNTVQDTSLQPHIPAHSVYLTSINLESR